MTALSLSKIRAAVETFDRPRSSATERIGAAVVLRDFVANCVLDAPTMKPKYCLDIPGVGVSAINLPIELAGYECAIIKIEDET